VDTEVQPCVHCGGAVFTMPPDTTPLAIRGTQAWTRDDAKFLEQIGIAAE
jgi:hypothetical protein